MIPRVIKKTKLYRFLSFLGAQYRQSQRFTYRPEDFAIFEKGAFVEPGAEIYHSQCIVMRECSVIHSGTLINASGGFHLGRYSGISYNCTIFTGDHVFLKAEAIPFDKRAFLKPVYIEDFVMIGTQVSIMPGVRIGEGAVVGMGSVVQKDIPPLSIVAGNPAEIIARRDENNFNELKSKGAFQSPAVGNYVKIIPLMQKRKYKEFIELIGLAEKLE